MGRGRTETMSNDLIPPNVHDVAVAAQGAVSGVLMARRSNLKHILGLLTVGTLTGVNCGPAIAEKFATNHDATVYLTGVVGWCICWVAIAIVKSKMPHQKAKQ
jgi:hypothetical protein